MADRTGRALISRSFEEAGRECLSLEWWSGFGQSLQVSKRPFREVSSGREDMRGPPGHANPQLPNGDGGEWTGEAPRPHDCRVRTVHAGPALSVTRNRRYAGDEAKGRCIKEISAWHGFAVNELMTSPLLP
jgi:hypothetical protein